MLKVPSSLTCMELGLRRLEWGRARQALFPFFLLFLSATPFTPAFNVTFSHDSLGSGSLRAWWHQDSQIWHMEVPAFPKKELCNGESTKDPSGNEETSYDLAPEVLGCHFYLVLLVIQVAEARTGSRGWKEWSRLDGVWHVYRKGKNWWPLSWRESTTLPLFYELNFYNRHLCSFWDVIFKTLCVRSSSIPICAIFSKYQTSWDRYFIVNFSFPFWYQGVLLSVTYLRFKSISRKQYSWLILSSILNLWTSSVMPLFLMIPFSN